MKLLTINPQPCGVFFPFSWGDYLFFVDMLLKVLKFCLTALASLPEVPWPLCQPAWWVRKPHLAKLKIWGLQESNTSSVFTSWIHTKYVQLPLLECLRNLPQLLESFSTQGCAVVTYPEKGNENDKNKCQGKQEFRFRLSSQNLWSPAEFKNSPYTAADVKDS